MTQKNTRTTALVALFALVAGTSVLLIGLQKNLSRSEMLQGVGSSASQTVQAKPLLQDIR